MKKTLLLLMLTTVAIKIVGFAKDLLLSYLYGASNITDAYIISFTFPDLIIGLFGAAVISGYIPQFNKIEKEHGEETANRYTNQILNLLIVFSVVVIVFVFAMAKPIVQIFSSRFDNDSIKIAVLFTRICIFSILFTSLSSVLLSFLQIRNKYILPAMIGLLVNMILLGVILVSVSWNVVILVIGTLAASIIEMCLLLFLAYKSGFRYQFVVDPKNKFVKEMLGIIVPVIIGSSGKQLSQLADRAIASYITVGAISALSYAHKLEGFVTAIFIQSIVTVIYPKISKLAARNDLLGLKTVIAQAIKSMCLFIIPVMAGTILFSKPIVSILLGRGAFGLEAESMTASALAFYSLGMIGLGINSVTTKAFYSFQDTKTPMIISLVSMSANILLDILLSRLMGLSGLALASSIAVLMSMLLQISGLRKKIGAYNILAFPKTLLKICFATALMSILSLTVYLQILKYLNHNLSFLISASLGMITYITVLSFLKIRDVDLIIQSFARKIRKHRKLV